MNLYKRIFAFFLTIIFVSTLAQPIAAEEGWPSEPDISATSAIVIEADTGAILYAKNPHERNYPASITKILTTLLALENSTPGEIVTFSHDAVHKIEGTHISIKEKEQLTMEQCLYGIMLASANDVAYAVAEHVGKGNLSAFIDMMNARAAALGCADSHFNNPHGLPDENHYTSAYDMSLIAREAYKNATFRAIAKTKTYTIPVTNLTDETRPLTNHHKMMLNTSVHYDACTGGKTGYTNAARNTLVTFAEKNDMKLICVVMHDDGTLSHYNDTIALFNYCFQNFSKTDLINTTLGSPLKNGSLFPLDHTPFVSNSLSLVPLGNTKIVLPGTLSVSQISSAITYCSDSPDKLADINYSYHDHFLGKISIGTNMQISESPKESLSTVPVKKTFRINLKFIAFCLLGVLGIVGIIAIVIYIRNNYHFNRRTKRLRRNQYSFKKKSSRRFR